MLQSEDGGVCLKVTKPFSNQLNPLNSLQFSTDHRDRADWQCVYAVGTWRHRHVFVLVGSVAELHKTDLPRERMLRVVRIIHDKVNLMRRIQVVVDEHERPIVVGTMHGVSGDDGARGGVN